MKETKRILKEQGLQGNVGIKGKDITKDIGWKEKKGRNKNKMYQRKPSHRIKRRILKRSVSYAKYGKGQVAW